MTNFEWHTDDHSSWEDEPVSISPPSRRKNNRIFIPLIIIALLLLTANVVYARLQTTLDSTVDATESELTATWKLINEKAQNGDMDIFSSLLSGSNPHWAYGYQLMVGTGGLLNRESFGLQMIEGLTFENDIVLSPDLTSAEITSTVSYAYNVGNGINQTITLHQPHVFRKGDTRWLLAPPTTQWWGSTLQEMTVWGTYTFPERDNAIVQRLMGDINLAWSSLCAATDAGYCAADTPTLEFSTDPQTFEALDQLPELRGAGTLLRVPTPSLVGLPTDDASYRALRAGYGRLILRRLLTDGLNTADGCCQNQQLFIDALTEHLLVDQGFIAASISAEQFRIALDQVAPTSFISTSPALGSYGEQQLTAAYVWLNFFHQQYPSTPFGEMLTRLAMYRDPVQWMQLNAARDDANAPSTETTVWLESHFSSYQLWLEAQFSQALQ